MRTPIDQRAKRLAVDQADDARATARAARQLLAERAAEARQELLRCLSAEVGGTLVERWPTLAAEVTATLAALGFLAGSTRRRTVRRAYQSSVIQRRSTGLRRP